MNNIIVEPPPIDPYPRGKRIVAEMQSVTVKMTPFVDFLTKSLPVGAAIATLSGYIMLLAYTNRYSIPFPYVFLPYLLIFSIIIFFGLIISVAFILSPLFLRLINSDVEHGKIIKIAAEGGWLRWRLLPQHVRYFVNLLAPSIVFVVAAAFSAVFQNVAWLVLSALLQIGRAHV